MYFIDLDKLKIEKMYHYQTFSVDIDLDLNSSAATILADLKNQLPQLFVEKPAIAALYQINLRLDVNDDGIDGETFETLVNIVNAAFFSLFITAEGRKREHRLDVPERLKMTHINLSTLKKAINYATFADKFNIEINGGGFTYILVDTNKMDEGEKINA